jgi:predicted Fe-S protein YdhL (DUF1289 family)
VTTPEVASPCIQVCQLDPQQVCRGCGRTLDEIAEWSLASAARKQQICNDARQRKTAMDDHGKNTAQ